jgi:hypothetical protein
MNYFSRWKKITGKSAFSIAMGFKPIAILSYSPIGNFNLTIVANFKPIDEFICFKNFSCAMLKK